MLKLLKIFEIFLGLPKSLYFNIYYFGFIRGIKLPILLSNKVKLLKLSGIIELNENNFKIGIIKIGFPSVGVFDYKNSRSIWEVYGKIKLKENIVMGQGTKISVLKNGVLEIGRNVCITGESTIICRKKIKFGDNCLISWENLFMDTDFHSIKDFDNKILNPDKEIEIGDKVWIGNRSTILKGTIVKNDSVIASNSRVSTKFNSEKVIIAGNPGEIIKENIEWE